MKIISNFQYLSYNFFFLFNIQFYYYSCYSYDTRNLKRPVNVHMDHVSAVTCIDYAPTGLEFVTGSYDKSVRIYESTSVMIFFFNKK